MNEMPQEPGPRIWWVNQGGTYPQSKTAGSLWAPFRTRAGHTQRHWDLLEQLKPGDMIVHASDKAVRALSRVVKPAYPAESPWKFTGFRSHMYNSAGRRVDIEMHELRTPIPIKDLSAMIMSVGQEGPFNKAGMLRQAYLTPFSIQGLRIVWEASSEGWPKWALRALDVCDRAE